MGSDQNTIAYYEKNDNEDINFLVMRKSHDDCFFAAFYAHETKYLPEAISHQPALLAALNNHYQEEIAIYKDEDCIEKYI